MTKYIVFDFDGTIADTFEVVKNIAKDELGASENIFKSLKDDGIRTTMEKEGISIWKLPKMALKVKSKLREAENINLFSGIAELMNGLKNNYKLGIVSSNSEQDILKILERYNIQNLFEFIYSDSSIFGKHLVLKRMCKKYKIIPEGVIYVGDEDRDIIAAKKNNIKNIAVTWGFNSRERLSKVNPDFIVDAPLQIVNIVSSI